MVDTGQNQGKEVVLWHVLAPDWPSVRVSCARGESLAWETRDTTRGRHEARLRIQGMLETALVTGNCHTMPRKVSTDTEADE